MPQLQVAISKLPIMVEMFFYPLLESCSVLLAFKTDKLLILLV